MTLALKKAYAVIGLLVGVVRLSIDAALSIFGLLLIWLDSSLRPGAIAR